MQRGFKTSCEQVAATMRRQLGLAPRSPLPSATLADHLGIVVVPADDIPGLPSHHLNQLLLNDPASWSAFTIQLEDEAFIVYNTAHALVRQESDIMHEVAHFLRKHEPSRLVALDGLALSLRTYDASQEEEASWLGACLQLPRPALVWAISEGMTEADISQQFTASVSQIRYRRGVTGVDIQRRRSLSVA